MRVFLSLFVLLTACTKPVTPGKLSDFQMPIGTSLFPACIADNEGKRFALTGHLVLNGDVTVSDGKLSLALAEKVQDGEGSGPYTYLELKEGKDLSIDVANVKWKSAGYRRQEGRGAITGITVHTASGDVPLETKVTAIVELTAQRLFQQKAIFGCTLEVIELRKP